MSQIIITYDDTLDQRVKTAFCGQYKRPDKVRDVSGLEIDNPMTMDEFVKNVLNSFVKEVVIAYEANLMAEQARQTAIAKGLNEVRIGVVNG